VHGVLWPLTGYGGRVDDPESLIVLGRGCRHLAIIVRERESAYALVTPPRRALPRWPTSRDYHQKRGTLPSPPASRGAYQARCLGPFVDARTLIEDAPDDVLQLRDRWVRRMPSTRQHRRRMRRLTATRRRWASQRSSFSAGPGPYHGALALNGGIMQGQTKMGFY
jgi:hypothetical protein